ncbi:MAG: DUF1573 domain-containing protein [Chloroflexi bacterium]|nr:DUF1573 domain-containing protein [Chloroflexota bacterium]
MNKTGALLAAIFALALLAIACSPSRKATPTPTPTPLKPNSVVLATPLPPFKGGPRLASQEASLDFGQVNYNVWVEAILHLQNVGDAPLVLQEPLVRVEEGCCPPLNPELGTTTLEPGESTFVRTSFTMAEGMGGKHVFGVLLRSNDPVEPEKRIEIRADFVP